MALTIGFEGPDGAGKTSIIDKILASNLALAIYAFHPFYHSEFGRKMEEIVKNSDGKYTDFQRTFAGCGACYSAIDLASEMHSQCLFKGEALFLLDRTMLSNYLYHKDTSSPLNISAVGEYFTRVHHLFIFDPSNIGSVARRRRGMDDISCKYYTDCIEEYDLITSPKVTVIDASQTIGKIYKQVSTIIAKLQQEEKD